MNPIRTDWCVTLEDLFRAIDPSMWNVTGKLAKESKISTKWSYCARVLSYFLYLVITDIIENNITLEIPCVGKKEARIYVKCFSDDEFIDAYKRGKFKGIDCIKSEFKGYQFMFQWRYGSTLLEKPIYIDRTLKAKFYENINNGKQYY